MKYDEFGEPVKDPLAAMEHQAKLADRLAPYAAGAAGVVLLGCVAMLSHYSAPYTPMTPEQIAYDVFLEKGLQARLNTKQEPDTWKAYQQGKVFSVKDERYVVRFNPISSICTQPELTRIYRSYAGIRQVVSVRDSFMGAHIIQQSGCIEKRNPAKPVSMRGSAQGTLASTGYTAQVFKIA